MEPPDRGRGRGRGRGRKHQYSSYGGRGKPFPAISEFPALGESSSQREKTVKEALVQGPQYIKKKVTESVFTLSEGDLNLTPKDPWCLKERYLQNQQYKVQEGKPRYIYEAILIETASVQITHHHHDEQDKRTPMTHSKMFIVRVIHPQEWGLSTLSTRSLKINEQKYNYWDYVNAWTYALYYQNPVRTHSWFFLINPEIITKETAFPLWFLHWWEKHSPEIEIFPDEIKNLFPIWFKFHPKLKGITSVNPPVGQSLLWFCTEYRITWIWQWNYEISEDYLNLPEIQRHFFVKWWSRFETEKCANSISEAIKQYQKDYKCQNPISNTSPGPINFIQQIKNMIQNQYPEYSEQEIDVKLMETMKDQYLATQDIRSSQSEDTKSDTSMTSQDLATQDQDIGRFACLAGEAQNPNINSEADPTAADLWDAMIEIKSLKNKKKI